MSAPLDVLAVMERAFDYAVADRQYEDAADLHNARAAVAELISADTEYDRARAAWLADNSKHDEFLATRAAWDRRAAALARIKGEAV